MTEKDMPAPLYSWFEPKKDPASGAVLVGEAAAMVGFDPAFP
ncbi:hypothetical protein [Salinibacterium sp. NK8237]|nr:hypothetical protein [Salinibacterium sp. NK8237]